MGRPKIPPESRPPCSVPGCNGKVYATKFCRPHYYQQLRGSELHPVRKPGPPLVPVTVRVSGPAAEAVRADRDGARDAIEEWAQQIRATVREAVRVGVEDAPADASDDE